MEDYLRGIAGLSLTNYVTYNAGSEDLSVYGLDNPERTITVRYTDGTEDAEEETFTLSISRPRRNPTPRRRTRRSLPMHGWVNRRSSTSSPSRSMNR